MDLVPIKFPGALAAAELTGCSGRLFGVARAEEVDALLADHLLFRKLIGSIAGRPGPGGGPVVPVTQSARP
jgi:hypothetical protein